jgi:hypothetical protein
MPAASPRSLTSPRAQAARAGVVGGDLRPAVKHLHQPGPRGCPRAGQVSPSPPAGDQVSGDRRGQREAGHQGARGPDERGHRQARRPDDRGDHRRHRDGEDGTVQGVDVSLDPVQQVAAVEPAKLPGRHPRRRREHLRPQPRQHLQGRPVGGQPLTVPRGGADHG